MIKAARHTIEQEGLPRYGPEMLRNEDLMKRKPKVPLPRQDVPTNSDRELNNGNNESAPLPERPRICIIDLEDDCTKVIETRFKCYSGSLGASLNVANLKQYDEHRCLPNHDFPPNLHEFDIVIIDLENSKRIDYDKNDHVHAETKGDRQVALLSSFPETVFDPRPLSASFLASELESLMQKESILVVFTAAEETVRYQPIATTPRGDELLSPENYSLYAFYRSLPAHRNVVGRDTIVVMDKETELGSLLNQYNSEMVYAIAFEHPTHWEGNKEIKDQDFFPLVEDGRGAIIAFARLRGKNFTFFLPQLRRRKPSFLCDFLERVLPGIAPPLFPYSTLFAWLDGDNYRLPNEETLRQEKKQLQDNYEASMKELEARIDANHSEYSFLHDLITQSGPSLVKTVENFLTWLEFENVVNVDETNPKLQEEDLRIDTEEGLLIIEIKGIGGTSTDAECAQISKIRYRRQKERGSLDVCALYIVNHQRYLPAEKRRNPPFSEIQIQDAENDDRGLLTTYDLFKLYSNVVDGHISKSDARSALFQKGMIRFQPSGTVKLADPREIHHGGHVVIFGVEGFVLRKGRHIILCDDGRYRSAEILEIQINGKSVDKADSGEVGVQLSDKVFGGTELWLRNDS